MNDKVAELCYEMTVEDLSGPATAAHIHYGPAGAAPASSSRASGVIAMPSRAIIPATSSVGAYGIRHTVR